MLWLRSILTEIWGLFVDDGRFALAILVWLAACWLVLPRFGVGIAHDSTDHSTNQPSRQTEFNNRYERCSLVQDDEGSAEVTFRPWPGGTPSSGIMLQPRWWHLLVACPITFSTSAVI